MNTAGSHLYSAIALVLSPLIIRFCMLAQNAIPILVTIIQCITGLLEQRGNLAGQRVPHVFQDLCTLTLCDFPILGKTETSN